MKHSALALVFALGLASSAGAQIRASELGQVTQMIDGTKISVEYSRPRSRGRETIFGTRAVHWEEVWTPGANWATTLDVNRNVRINGRPVAKGKYSLWLIVKKEGDWTAVLDPKPRRFHMDRPDSSANQVRFPVKRQEIPFTDVLTFSFPALRANGGTLAMDWERTRIAMDVEVEPTLTEKIAESDARAFVGEYAYTEKGPNGGPPNRRLVVTYENGTLKGEWFSPADTYMNKFALLRIAPDWFAPGLYDRTGQIFEVLRPDFVFEFKRVGGKVTTFDFRSEDDDVIGTGTRRP